jgi:23S rRNA (pseudouridine1915-N3)-methyltransferase
LKVVLLFVGKTTDTYLKEGIEIYYKRLFHYVATSIEVISASSLTDKKKAMAEEAKFIQAKLKPADFLVVLDENGTQMTSRKFADFFVKLMNQSIDRIVFITGGAFGIDDELKKKAKFILSVSQFTFTHQMIRLILVEQIYRAMTITKGEAYHHD